jgi:hypothetical protein
MDILYNHLSLSSLYLFIRSSSLTAFFRFFAFPFFLHLFFFPTVLCIFMDAGNMHRDGALVDAPMAEAQQAAPASGGESTQTLEDITLAMLDQLGAAGACER